MRKEKKSKEGRDGGGRWEKRIRKGEYKKAEKPGGREKEKRENTKRMGGNREAGEVGSKTCSFLFLASGRLIILPDGEPCSASASGALHCNAAVSGV